MAGRVRLLRSALLVAAVLALPVSAGAVYTASASVSANTFSVATLGPAGALSDTWTCPGGYGNNGGFTLTLTWPASPSAFVQGYVVSRAPSSGGPWTQIAVTASTTVDDTGISKKTAAWYRVVAFAYLWLSSPSDASTTAPNPAC